MRNLNCELLQYTAKNGKVFDYVTYKYTNDEAKTCEEFSNMEFFVVDVKCEEFLNIMSSTGGFCAEMTTRLFEKEQLDIAYMMLVAIPQTTNNFFFNFLYFGKTGKLLRKFFDNNYTDYSYFKKKFKMCTIARGSVYDLLDDNCFEVLKAQISDKTSTDYDLIIEGRPVTKEDTIIFNDSSVCINDYEMDYIKERGIVVDHFEFKLDFGGINFVYFTGVAVKASGEVVKDYEMDSECLKNGVNTFEEYVAYKKQKLEEFFGHDVNCEIKSEDYTFRISFDFAKHYSNKLSYKE